jgi:hypothetical protein
MAAGLRQALAALKKDLERLQALPTGAGTIPPEWLIKDENGMYCSCPKKATPPEAEMYETVVAMRRTMGTG